MSVKSEGRKLKALDRLRQVEPSTVIHMKFRDDAMRGGYFERLIQVGDDYHLEYRPKNVPLSDDEQRTVNPSVALHRLAYVRVAGEKVTTWSFTRA